MILLVEDDPLAASSIQRGLEQDGYRVDAALDGEQGLYLAQTRPYDLILLDIMLPGIDGFTLLDELRAQGITTPVLFLTARDALSDRLRGLASGGGDYLAKPFSFSELLLRVRNLLQRHTLVPERAWTVGDLQVDPARRKVSRGGRRLDLTAQEFTLLELLMRHAGHIVTRTRIAETLWDVDYEGDPNLVDAAVGRLRRKVDAHASSPLIHTLRSVGYRLEALDE